MKVSLHDELNSQNTTFHISQQLYGCVTVTLTVRNVDLLVTI